MSPCRLLLPCPKAGPEIIKLVSQVPTGYVTSNVAIAASIYKKGEKQQNGRSNLQKSRCKSVPPRVGTFN
jgi:hypothetical protein